MKKKSIIALCAAAVLVCGGCTFTTESQNEGQQTDGQQQTDNQAEIEEIEGTSQEAPEADMSADPEESSEPENGTDASAPEEENGEDTVSNTNTDSPVSASDWATIQDYGFNEDGYSLLSYTLHGETLTDEGDYYTVEATFAKPVIMPENPQVGESYDITVNDLEGKTQTITCVGETQFVDEYDMDIYCYADEGQSQMYMYEGSNDRIDSDFYEGKLWIRKDAVTGAAILQQPYETITEEDLSREDYWINGLKFDDDGFVTELIFFGD